MNKRIIGLLIVLVILVSSIVLFLELANESSEESKDQGYEEHSTNDIIGELEKNLLDENDEIEIGEIV